MKLSGTDVAQSGHSKYSRSLQCPWCEKSTLIELGVQHRDGDVSLHCSACSKFSRHIVADKWFDDHIQKERDLKEVWKKIPSDAWLTCRQSIRNTPFVYTLYLGEDQRPEEFFSRDTVEQVLMSEFGMNQKQAAGALISAALTPGLKIYLQRHTRLVMAAEAKEDMKRTGDAGIKTGTPVRCNGVDGLFLRYSANEGFAIVALPAAKGDFGDAEVPVVDLEVVDAGGPEVAEDFEMEKAEGEEGEAGTLEEALDHIDEAEDIIEDLVLEEEGEYEGEDTEDDEMTDLDFSEDEDKDEGKEDKDLPFEASRRIAVEWSDLRKRPTLPTTGPSVQKLQVLRSIIDDPKTDPQTLQEAQKQWTVLRKTTTPPSPRGGRRTASKEAQRRVHVHYTHSGDLKRAIEANRQELSIEDIRTLTNFYANTGKIAHHEADEISELFIGTKPRLLCAADTQKKCKHCGKECEGPIWGTTMCSDCAAKGKTAQSPGILPTQSPAPQTVMSQEGAEAEGKVCGECGSTTSQCPKCSKDFLLGNVAYCPDCEYPAECTGCAQSVSEDLDGVVSIEGVLIPWGTEKAEDYDLENFFREVGPAEKESAEDLELEKESPQCPMCGGPGESLGGLGNRAHYRCRNCGMDFSQSTSARHKDGCECGFCSRMRENQDWKKNRGTESKEAQSFKCQECGRKIPKGRRKCPKCGSEDIDIDVHGSLCAKDSQITAEDVLPGQRRWTYEHQCLNCGRRFKSRESNPKCPHCQGETETVRHTVGPREEFIHGSSRIAVAPPGRELEVKHLKDEPGVENPWALSWYKKEKGHKPHTESSPHTKQKASLSVDDLKKEACFGVFTPALYDGSEVLIIAIDNTSLQATVQDGDGKQKVVEIADLKPVKKGPFSGESKDAAKRCKVCGDPMVPRKTFKEKGKKPLCSCPA